MERKKLKSDVKKEIYTKILTMMCRKIETAYFLGKDETQLIIPEFVFGYPMYNMTHVTIFIYRQLKRLGYRTSVINIGLLNVAWGEKKQTKQISKEEDNTLPTLSNLKKAADSIRKKYTHESK